MAIGREAAPLASHCLPSLQASSITPSISMGVQRVSVFQKQSKPGVFLAICCVSRSALGLSAKDRCHMLVWHWTSCGQCDQYRLNLQIPVVGGLPTALAAPMKLVIPPSVTACSHHLMSLSTSPPLLNHGDVPSVLCMQRLHRIHP